jgi:hypothetical protein
MDFKKVMTTRNFSHQNKDKNLPIRTINLHSNSVGGYELNPGWDYPFKKM